MRSTRIRALIGLPSLGLVSLACVGGSDQLDGVDPWAASFHPPMLLTTDRVRLEPLSPDHVELDFAALMGSREHLLQTLDWNPWPRADFTIEENLKDLERHFQEFEDREAYAYTVLTPDGSECIGCIYINPFPKEGLFGNDNPRRARMIYWVVEDGLATDLDRHLLESVLSWIESDWPYEWVAMPAYEGNPRGVEVAEELGMSRYTVDQGIATTDGDWASSVGSVAENGSVLVWRR